MPSTRRLLVVVAALLFAGCIGGVAGQPADVRLANESPVPVAATLTVIDAGEPLADRPVVVTYRNGTTVRTQYERYMVGVNRGPFDAPSNTTDLRVLEGVERRSRTTLDPGETTTRTVRTAGLDGGEVVLVRWTRLDIGRVTWAVPLRCRNSVLTGASATVEDADSGGSTGKTCQ